MDNIDVKVVDYYLNRCEATDCKFFVRIHHDYKIDLNRGLFFYNPNSMEVIENTKNKMRYINRLNWNITSAIFTEVNKSHDIL